MTNAERYQWGVRVAKAAIAKGKTLVPYDVHVHEGGCPFDDGPVDGPRRGWFHAAGLDDPEPLFAIHRPRLHGVIQ